MIPATRIKQGQRGSVGDNLPQSASAGISGPTFGSTGSRNVTRQSATLHGT
ncbi:hypothetical protein [Synechococcus sp. MIT S9510]|uniref:hypothetical protein n=1 Tax=unclassified Synechococcus TaxID=2626047 RepID=UPI0039B01532